MENSIAVSPGSRAGSLCVLAGVERRRSLSVAIFIALIACWLVPAVALAAGRVEWKSKSIKETDESWKIDVTIYLPKPPDTALTPVRFSFTPVVYYERTLVDNHDGPIVRKVPLQNRQPIVESVDVGFLDPGTGKLENRTKFSFKVTRAHGFEAGEYDVSIKDGRSGSALGTTVHLKFEGDNEVIDRRAMVFAEKKKEKKPEPEVSEEKPAAKEGFKDPNDPAYWEGGPTEPEPKDEALPPPASLKEKPGACGCRLIGDESKAGATSNAASLALLGLAAIVWGRRRQRR